MLVCTPPHLHVSQALSGIRHGAHAFVEKPLSDSMHGVDELIDEAEARERVLQVGYHWRFDRGLRTIKRLLDEGAIGRVLWARAEYGHYLPNWRPGTDYRESYSARHSMGGGVLLDSSHDIDYMLWLFGEVEQVYCFAGVLSDLEMDAEDTASMVLRFRSGCLGEIHLDALQRTPSHSCKIVGTEGTLAWDLLEEQVQILRAESDQCEQSDVTFGTRARYKAEIKSFLDCLAEAKAPEADAYSARRTLEVALAARESASTHQVQNIASYGRR